MKTKLSTLEKVVDVLNALDIKSEVIINDLVKKGEPVVSIFNSDLYIVVKEKKNSNNIYFLYEYDEHAKVNNKWLMGSIDILDITDKIQKYFKK